MDRDKILILSYGGDQAYTLARRLRSGQFYCEIMDAAAPAAHIAQAKPKGIIITGSPELPDGEGLQCDPGVYDLGLPVLGIGRGARQMAAQLGGNVRHTALENQTLQLHFVSSSPLFEGLSYSDRYVTRLDMIELPAGFQVIAHGHGIAAAFACEEKKLYGMQFSVEVNDPDGLLILDHFAADICGMERRWTTENIVSDIVSDIRERVGGAQALMALSGGVDSSVCATLMHRAIGENMHCLYIDTGLMRKGDTRVVREELGLGMNMSIHCVNARDRFYEKLKGLTDPMEKWQAIRSEFSDIYKEEAARYPQVEFLVKGTIYSDLLSLSPEDQNLNELMGYHLIEPARFLFKNEVRDVGAYLGLPEIITQRQSLPGSGLAMRVTGEATPEKVNLVREADAILREEMEQTQLARKAWRFCAQLSDTTSTGGKACKYIIALRALSRSGAASVPCRLPYDMLERVTGRILSEFPQVDRVVYDMTPSPERGM